ncbi:nucleotidyltransferase domain-containing protein [Patescibacteria group bacterium]|nr:nucleotidyltransferase domain-containing protein [Patescibacteria group bacterium]
MIQSIPANVQTVVDQIITNYKPEKIVLFGSHAEGHATPDSDYDLFMIKDTSGTITKRQYDVWKSINNWSIPFDFIVYTPEEVLQAKQAGSWFMNHIETKGKILYAN